MKPGDSVEGKTLPIRKGEMRVEVRAAQLHGFQAWLV